MASIVKSIKRVIEFCSTDTSTVKDKNNGVQHSSKERTAHIGTSFRLGRLSICNYKTKYLAFQPLDSS
jgi:hypothetical protein